jgi:hypothetical protein
MIITRSGLTIRCARCRREVAHFVAAYVPDRAAWTVMVHCHGDSVTIEVPDATGEGVAFRRQAVAA